MGRVWGRGFIFIAVSVYILLSSGCLAQGGANERILFHAKVFTAEPENPYAEAVAIRGDQIVAVGNLSEVEKAVSKDAERVDLAGKSLFPGFIDSHSHSIEGGLSLLAADATDKVDTVDQLPAFMKDAKDAGRGMRGDIFVVEGIPLGAIADQTLLLHRLTTKSDGIAPASTSEAG